VFFMTKLRGVGIGLVFIVGCAVGGAAGQLAVPAASAQQAASLTKWEYTCVGDIWKPAEIAAKANEAGAQGWEMTSVAANSVGWTWCFKRPKG
jgi:hypothetical protein